MSAQEIHAGLEEKYTELAKMHGRLAELCKEGQADDSEGPSDGSDEE